MKLAYYFIDPAFFSTTNPKEYKRKDTINEFAKFYNLLKKIEGEVLPNGSKKKLFGFPIKKSIINKCIFEYPHGIANTEESKFFWSTFRKLDNSYFIYCRKEGLKRINGLYFNPNVPAEVIMLFNSFLEGCFSDQDCACGCRSIAESSSIYINSETILKENKKLVSFKYQKDLMIHFPLLLIYPSEKDSIERKKKKMRLLLEMNYYRYCKKLLPEDSFKITDKFWKSDYLLDGDDRLKKDIIKVMTDLIVDPSTTENERKILKGKEITIKGVKRRLEQCYINQHRKLKGKEIYPRLLFTVHENKIYFIKVIEGH